MDEYFFKEVEDMFSFDKEMFKCELFGFRVGQSGATRRFATLNFTRQ